MQTTPNQIARFFNVIARGQTWLNLLYLLLAFPLGLAYFIFFVVGISLAIPLMFILVGFAVLAIVGLGWWAFASFERLLAIWVLKMEIPPMSKPGAKPEGAWETFVSLLSNPVTWKSLLYLLVKFPLGIFSFVMLVVLGAISLAFLTAPLTFWWNPVRVDLTGVRYWAIDTPVEAAVAFIFGLLFLFVSFHVWNYLAYVSGVFARLMLGNEPPKLSEYDMGGILKEAEDLIRPVEETPVAPEPRVEAMGQPEGEQSAEGSGGVAAVIDEPGEISEEDEITEELGAPEPPKSDQENG